MRRFASLAWQRPPARGSTWTASGRSYGPVPGCTMHEWLLLGRFPVGSELRVRLLELGLSPAAAPAVPGPRRGLPAAAGVARRLRRGPGGGRRRARLARAGGGFGVRGPAGAGPEAARRRAILPKPPPQPSYSRLQELFSQPQEGPPAWEQ
ncbi:unnamed protein product [Prorocentrum cordatum]|uniref:GYF domain-containing protein n=1 Tax=Prorocentrum cordatum TaxID=2364126 RepID=A0ABN9TS07_9DINO|nr:unnamed protein product [Polarella glacialis]